MKIRVLDLFSGIGGFHLGLEKAGFEVESYFSEIDKYAIDVYSNNFKTAQYVGSVTDVRGGDLPDIDAITFGSPCQDFSLAGGRKGLGGKRSSLISEAIRLIGEKRPRFFIWENVKGTFSSNSGQDFAAILQAFANIGGYRLEWQLLNTKWFLPQNRERIYLVGYLGGGSGRQIFPIGESFGEDGGEINIVGDTLKGGERGRIYSPDGIMSTLSATDWKQPKQIKIKSATQAGYEEAGEGDSINLTAINSKTRRGRVGEGVAQTLDTLCDQAVVAGAIRGRYVEDGGTQQHLELRDDNNTNTLTSVQKDNMVVAGTWRTHKDGEGFREVKGGDAPTIPARAREDGSGQPVVKLNTNYSYKKVNETIEKNADSFIEGEPKMMDLHNRSVHDHSPCLVEPHHNNSSLFNGKSIRRLTPIECERLQGFPDNWTAIGKEIGNISDTQRYKMCGNAVTVDVVAAVARNIKETVYGK